MNPTTNTARAPFKPTLEMIAAAENIFLAMFLEQWVRPIVEDYERKIVAERSWRLSSRMPERIERRSPDQPVEQ